MVKKYSKKYLISIMERKVDVADLWDNKNDPFLFNPFIDFYVTIATSMPIQTKIEKFES